MRAYLASLERLKRTGRDISGDAQDYDLQGMYADGGAPALAGLQRGHGVDTYKKPNHPTFSQESKYSTPERPGGAWWEDRTSKAGWAFTPSPQMLADGNRTPEGMRRYFDEVEPGVGLRMPPTDDVLLERERAKKAAEAEELARFLAAMGKLR